MPRSSFDYIVSGSGAAGSIVAARLGANPHLRILVLEAGPSDNSIYVRMPAALSYPLTDKKRTWSFETGPEPELSDRYITHVRGKMFGGSGSLNGMSPGLPAAAVLRDFDRWASDFNLPSWSYAHCLPYFKRMETFDKGADAYRGGGGPIAVTAMKAELPPFRAFLEAGQQAMPSFDQRLQRLSTGRRARLSGEQRGVASEQAAGRQYLRPADPPRERPRRTRRTGSQGAL